MINDNELNMPSVCTGLTIIIKSINSLDDFIPWSVYLLNLGGKNQVAALMKINF